MRVIESLNAPELRKVWGYLDDATGGLFLVLLPALFVALLLLVLVATPFWLIQKAGEALYGWWQAASRRHSNPDPAEQCL